MSFFEKKKRKKRRAPRQRERIPTLDFLVKAWKGRKASKQKFVSSKELSGWQTWTTSKAMRKCMCIQLKGKLQERLLN
jgi:hypothetical protein